MVKSEEEKTIQKLEAENQLKTRWLALIAHDFKGMFNRLLWMLDAYENEVVSREIFLSMLPEIKRNAMLNANILKDTFRWINMQVGGFDPQLEPLDIYKLFFELKSLYEPELTEKNLSFVYKGNQSLILESDRILFTFVLKKLIENAIKYSNEGNEIGMEAIGSPSVNRIIIEDHGIGMEASVLKNIFTLEGAPYNGTYEEKGAGLSLIIVKDFITLLNGELKIESTENKGATVELSFYKKPAKTL